ncbi:hypothetical protein [Limimaricola hongkongensis]|uniref:Uncharacterized protein n=1 Tax=Limimaricola hongkongensis DSM 17492 TaxID=1122180 RepID=A0A017HAY4_9RHOB|nr:hypothetical protein [Limimaricola hongkongensis]EYD71647.1 hypothetical protein Lokhon_01714 [Limimaricola hongkongensis DSM 17492]
MADPITSTIAQLLFRGAPDLDFPALVDDLRTALNDLPARDCALNWDHEDVAVFELDNARIILAYTQAMTGRYAACLTIGVGADETGDCQIGIASHQGTITRLLADRINARFMSDRMLWKTSARIASVEMIDELVDALPGLDPSRPGLHTSSAEIDRMLARYDAETAEQVSELAPEVPEGRPRRPRRPQRPGYRTERPKKRPAADRAWPANDAPAALHPMIEEMRRIREALRPTEEEAQAERQPRTLLGLSLARLRGRSGSAVVAGALMLTLGLPVGGGLPGL